MRDRVAGKARFLLLCGAAPVFAGAAMPVLAQTTSTWQGTTSSDVADPSNWTPPANLDAFDGAVIIDTSTPNAATWSVSESGSNSWTTGAGLQIGTNSLANGSLTVTASDAVPSSSYPYMASIYTGTGSIDVGVNSGAGLLNLDLGPNPTIGNGVRLETYGEPLENTAFRIGDGIGSSGTANVLGDGKNVREQGYSYYQVSGIWHPYQVEGYVGSNQGNGTLNLDGGILVLGQTGSGASPLGLQVGSTGGTGTVNVLSGGKLGSPLTYVGIQAISVIGQSTGSGTLNISGTAADGSPSKGLLGTGLEVGVGSGSRGAVNVLSGGKTTSYTQMWSGTTDPARPVHVGVNGGSGTALVSGAGSEWIVLGALPLGVETPGTTAADIGTLSIGASGTGVLTIAEGGLVQVGSSVLQSFFDEDTGESWYDLGTVSPIGSLLLGETASGVGTLNIGAAAGQAAVAPGTLGAAQIGIGPGSGTVVFNHTSGSYQFDTPIAGAGTIAAYAGTTYLVARAAAPAGAPAGTPTDNSGFSGFTEVHGGALGLTYNAALGTSQIRALDAGGALIYSDGVTIANPADIASGAALALSVPTGSASQTGAISGAGTLRKTGAGTLTLTAANPLTGETDVDAGTLALGSGASLSSSSRVVADGTFDVSAAASPASIRSLAGAGTAALGPTRLNLTAAADTFAGSVTGSGTLAVTGGSEILTGNSGAYLGNFAVDAGALWVNGVLGSNNAVGSTVAAGATLGGNGSVAGSVTVNGTLTPGADAASVGEFAIGGSLTLGSSALLDYQFGRANFAGGTLNDLVTVGGDVTLGGTINVAETSGGSFAPGIYRVIDYGGSLLGGTLAIGTTPPAAGLSVQTAISGEVNLIIESAPLDFWDGDAGPKNNGQIDGGNGTWVATTGNNWTDENGAINAPYNNGTFAIFAGAPGTVTIDNSLGQVQASGLQFATDGYVITGAPLELIGTQATVRVGAGIARAAGDVATIDAPIIGSAQLVKTDPGTLVLGGANTFSGGTRIEQGTVQVAADANLGTGGLTFEAGTLRTTASFGSTRAVTLEGGGTVLTDSGTVLTLGGLVSGAGALTKAGAGTLALTGANSWTGGSVIDEGVLLASADANLGATSGTITFDGGTLQTTATFTTNRDTVMQGNGTILTGAGTRLSYGGVISGAGTLTKSGAGALWLAGNSSYTGGIVIADGTLQISNSVALGAGAGVVTFRGGTLESLATLGTARAFVFEGDGRILTDLGTTLTASGPISGAGALVKTGGGTLSLTGTANSYSGGTQLLDGVVQVFADANLGDPAGGLTFSGGTLQTTASFASNRAAAFAGTGTILTDPATTLTLDGPISGAGTFHKAGAGDLVVVGDGSAFAGSTSVDAGALWVNGTLGGAVAVAAGSRVGGSGTVGGDLTVAGTLSPGSDINAVGTLSVGGNLALQSVAVLDYQFGAPGAGGLNDLTEVAGNLTLDGTINVTTSPGGTFGPGIYRVINYAGSLTDNGLVIGSTPTLTNLTVQTAVATEVNLIYAGGATLSYWDGDAGGRNDGVIDGGNGIWRAAGDDNWTDANGTVNAPFANGSFAVFQGTAGTVIVDGSQGAVNVSGMQFAEDGYLVTGDPLTLVGTQAYVRVGEGTLRALGYTATIGSAIGGSAQLVKSDGGTLVLTGANTYTGGTLIEEGTLRVGADANLGAGSGALGFGTGTLQTTGTFATARAVAIANSGTFLTDPGTALTVTGVVSGAGSLVKAGDGALVLTGGNSYAGGTAITGGVLQVTADANLGAATGGITFDAGTLATTGSFTSSRAVALAGSGTIDTASGTRLVLSGALSGGGMLTKAGAGTLDYTGQGSAQTGGVAVNAGTLLVNGALGGNVAANSTVASGATLGGGGTLGGNLIVADGGILSPGNSPGTLTITGSLALSSGSILDYQLGEPGEGGLNDLINVGGNLTLDGTINIAETDGGSFGPGIYRLINYAGSLSDNGLALGTVPPANLTVQTSVANQVNLVYMAAAAGLNYWDGDAGPKNDGTVNGGNGLWQNVLGNDNWTDANGAANSPYANESFAIFTGSPGTVTIDTGLGSVTSSGMQFATGGYVIQGDQLILVGPQSIVRVGDGTTAGAAYTARIDAELTGNAQLVKTDAGTLVLAGANTYTGGTRIEGGTVSISQDGNLGSSIGVVTFAGGTLETTASLTSGRVFNFEGAGTIATDPSTAFTITGPIVGSGAMTKAGTGTLIVEGTDLAYTGAAQVAAGTLQVDGALGGTLAVLKGATLTGDGVVGATTIQGGARVAPGSAAAPGTLQVLGDYAQQSGGLYHVRVDPQSTESDRIAVTGTASLAGGATLDVAKSQAGSYRLGTRYTVLTTGGGLSGTFTVTGDTALSAFLGLDAVYDANNAYLEVDQTRALTDADCGPRNQHAVAGGAETLADDSGLKNALLSSADDAAACDAFGQLSGEIHASLRAGMLDDTRFLREAVRHRLDSDDTVEGPGPGLWGNLFGSWGHYSATDQSVRMERDIKGGFAGADIAFGDNWRGGVVAGYSEAKTNPDSWNSTAKDRAWYLGAYGGANYGPIALELGAAYTWHNIRTRRSVGFNGFTDSLRADYDGSTTQVFGEAGYDVVLGTATVRPIVNLAYVHLQTDAFAERGGAAALWSNKDKMDTVFMTLGARGTYDLAIGGPKGLKLNGLLGWRHAFGDVQPWADGGFLEGGSAFSVSGAAVKRDVAAIEAGLDYDLGNGLGIGASYSGQIGNGYQDHAAKIHVDWRF